MGAPARVYQNSTATSSNQIGSQALAVNGSGDVVAAWQEKKTQDGPLTVRVSAFAATTGTWAADAQTVSGVLSAGEPTRRPGLVFDGQIFMTAWTGQDVNALGACANQNCTYTSRGNAKGGGWIVGTPRQTTTANLSANNMPALASDGRGNLMLVWPTPSGN